MASLSSFVSLKQGFCPLSSAHRSRSCRAFQRRSFVVSASSDFANDNREWVPFGPIQVMRMFEMRDWLWLSVFGWKLGLWSLAEGTRPGTLLGLLLNMDSPMGSFALFPKRFGFPSFLFVWLLLFHVHIPNCSKNERNQFGSWYLRCQRFVKQLLLLQLQLKWS